MDRGDHSNISTCISKAIDNEFSGNMIDVCPVGALTDKTFRFKSRVWFNKPYNAHRDCDKCCGKTTVWMFGNEIQRVTGRKDEYHEVEEFICNSCRFDHKEVSDWVIEGPRKFEKDSVINQNKYNRNIQPVQIATEIGILKGREQDRKKISMAEVPLSNEEEKEFQKGNL
jgi:NADH-quinone oxidoreductase subunit G